MPGMPVSVSLPLDQSTPRAEEGNSYRDPQSCITIIQAWPARCMAEVKEILDGSSTMPVFWRANFVARKASTFALLGNRQEAFSMLYAQQLMSSDEMVMARERPAWDAVIAGTKLVAWQGKIGLL